MSNFFLEFHFDLLYVFLLLFSRSNVVMEVVRKGG